MINENINPKIHLLRLRLFNGSYFLTPTPKLRQFLWIGEQRPDSRSWKRFYWKNKLFLKQMRPVDSHFLFLQQDNFFENISQSQNCIGKQFSENFFYFLFRDIPYAQYQIIHSLCPYEQNLLHQTQCAPFPYEIGQMNFIPFEGQTLHSPLILGNLFNLSSLGQLKETLLQGIYQSKKLGQKLQSIELTHVHPTVEIVMSTSQSVHYFLSGLSESDIKIAYYLAQLTPVPLILKALTPTGFSYSIAFYPGGEDATGKILPKTQLSFAA